MDDHTQKYKTILVLEDEQALADAIRAKLEKYGFAVTTARTVEQALAYLDELHQVDAIWLDHYLLGTKNGLDFVAELKVVGGKWNGTPIFVISNTASPEMVRSYMHLGIKRYYVKAEHRLDEIIEDIKRAVESGDGK